LDFEKLNKEQAALIQKINEYDDRFQSEMTEGQGGRGKGEGPVALALRRERENAENQLLRFNELNAAEFKVLQERKEDLRKKKEEERQNNEKDRKSTRLNSSHVKI